MLVVMQKQGTFVARVWINACSNEEPVSNAKKPEFVRGNGHGWPCQCLGQGRSRRGWTAYLAAQPRILEGSNFFWAGCWHSEDAKTTDVPILTDVPTTKCKSSLPEMIEIVWLRILSYTEYIFTDVQLMVCSCNSS